MRILFLGDVMGRSGRRAVANLLPDLRERLRLDFVIVNGENAAHGRGIAPKMADAMFDAGADVITLGDHGFDNRAILVHLEREPRILRPLNIARDAPGAGARVYEAGGDRSVLVVNALGRLFLKNLCDNPFDLVREALERAPIGRSVTASVLDFHCEATSEKMAMGHWCDGLASLVVGTHTHVPTADARILPGGTAYLTDAGMCGSYESVIGMEKEEPMQRFVRGMGSRRLDPDSGAATLCGVVADIDDRTGLANSVHPLRVGGVLAEELPAG